MEPNSTSATFSTVKKNNNNFKILLFTFLGLIAGLALGYYFGFSRASDLSLKSYSDVQNDSISPVNKVQTEVALEECLDETINIQVNTVPLGWSCSYTGEGFSRVMSLKRNDGLSIGFWKELGTDYFPENCPETITTVQVGDANQPIDMCWESSSSQWAILEQVMYNRDLAEKSNTASDGLFYISMNTSMQLAEDDKSQLKAIFDSITLLQ